MGIIKNLLAGSTKRIGTVCDVELDRYLGTWYEIARLPHAFEQGMSHVTATYTSKQNGVIEVLNSGIREGKTVSIKGKAFVIDPGCTGKLAVQFFPFIKSSYRIVALDKENYEFALVTSSKKSFLWLLCRHPQMDDRHRTDMISRARMMGFNVNKLIWVDQGPL